MKAKKALILAPHTDDGEFGCGGTIAKLLRNGCDVWYVAFSKCEDSLPKGWAKDTLVKEVMAATNVLGIKSSQVMVKNYKVRHFPENRQEILDDLIELRKNINPDVVFMPSIHDIHQDHSTIAYEGLRAFKNITIFSYEVPWNNFTFHNQAFVEISEDDANIKISALKKYESQYGRAYATEDVIRSILRVHGMQIGKKYAEVCEIPRMVLGEKI